MTRCASGPRFLLSFHVFVGAELPHPLQKQKSCSNLPRCFGGQPLMGHRSKILLLVATGQVLGETTASLPLKVQMWIHANGHHVDAQEDRWHRGSSSCFFAPPGVKTQAKNKEKEWDGWTSPVELCPHPVLLEPPSLFLFNETAFLLEHMSRYRVV